MQVWRCVSSTFHIQAENSFWHLVRRFRRRLHKQHARTFYAIYKIGRPPPRGCRGALSPGAERRLLLFVFARAGFHTINRWRHWPTHPQVPPSAAKNKSSAYRGNVSGSRKFVFMSEWQRRTKFTFSSSDTRASRIRVPAYEQVHVTLHTWAIDSLVYYLFVFFFFFTLSYATAEKHNGRYECARNNTRSFIN